MKKIILGVCIVFSLNNLSAAPYCKNMKNCKEACKYLRDGYTRLDRDKDGIPCENVCTRPCKKVLQ